MTISNRIRMFVHYFGRFNDDPEFNKAIEYDEKRKETKRLLAKIKKITTVRKSV